jgi:hypothetical protein
MEAETTKMEAAVVVFHRLIRAKCHRVLRCSCEKNGLYTCLTMFSAWTTTQLYLLIANHDSFVAQGQL